MLAYIAQQKVKNVILAGSWPGTPLFKRNILLTVRAIMDTGAKVYVLKDVPIPGFDVPRAVAITAKNGGDLEKLGLAKAKYDLMIRELSQTFDQISQMGATVLDPSGYFLNRNGLYGVVQNGQVLYCDDNHLSVEGSKILAPLFAPIFKPE